MGNIFKCGTDVRLDVHFKLALVKYILDRHYQTDTMLIEPVVIAGRPVSLHIRFEEGSTLYTSYDGDADIARIPAMDASMLMVMADNIQMNLTTIKAKWCSIYRNMDKELKDLEDNVTLLDNTISYVNKDGNPEFIIRLI